MPNSIFKFILKYSYKKQIYITFITLISFPILYLSLELPKTIINEGIGTAGRTFDSMTTFLGFEVGQVEYLLILSFLFLFTILITGLIKMYINTYKGRLGEYMLRKLRFILFHKLLRFPSSHFQTLTHGQIIPMITSEIEPLGGFIGDAFALPIFQGGTLLVYISFIFIQDPLLGFAAISLYPIQAYIIPKLQRKINLLTKERVKKVRILSDGISDTTTSINEIHLNASEKLHLADFTKKITEIFKIRYQIYYQKFFMKFLNNFFNQITPFFFYSIGGYFVIKGDVSIGALVAVLAAYKDLASPWKELLNFYQQKENVKIKYTQVTSQFENLKSFDESVFKPADTSPIKSIKEKLNFNLVTLKDETGQYFLKDINLELDLSKKTIISGNKQSNKEYIGKLIARSDVPSQGSILIKNRSFNKLPLAFTSKKITYLSKENMILNTTIFKNIVHGILMPHQINSLNAKNIYSEKNINQYLKMYTADTAIDYKAANVNNKEELQHKIIDLAKELDLDEALYQFGLNQTLSDVTSPYLIGRILMARKAIEDAIKKSTYKNIIKRYHKNKFNEHATVIENLIFGAPCLTSCSFDKIYTHPYFIQTLKKTGLYDELIHIGIKLAIIIQGIFANIPDGHHFFDQYDFVTPNLICEYKKFINKYEGYGKHHSHSVDNFTSQEQDRLIQFTFQLIPSRHRLGLMDNNIQKKIVRTRELLMKKIPSSLKKNIVFFNEKTLNNNVNILENILFGKVIFTKAKAQEKVDFLIRDAINQYDFSDDIKILGLNHPCGPNGSKLTSDQIQKINILKALIKNSELLIFDSALNLLDQESKKNIQKVILNHASKKGIIWIDESFMSKQFDTHIYMDNGMINLEKSLKK